MTTVCIALDSKQKPNLLPKLDHRINRRLGASHSGESVGLVAKGAGGVANRAHVAMQEGCAAPAINVNG